MRTLVVIIIGLLIAVGLPEIPINGLVASRTTMTGHVEREAFFWIVTAILIAYILLVEKRPLSSIGLKRPAWKSLAFGIAAGVLLVAGFMVIFTVVMPALHLKMNQSAMAGLLHTPLWFRFILVLRAAVFEEIAYRGYSIERTQELTGSRIFAFLFSVAAFTYAHAGYWGWASLLIPAFGGIVFAALYLWRRDLSCNMIAHFIADGAGFLFSG
jgi:membrane protease YdiL (CAAX protease family)